MAENRPPVAIRIVRPYETEDEFLENELETVGKTSVILIGAHPRPTGVILRFEMNLASGATILRGEGRVLAHKESAFRGQSGLTLRFTRLDPKSKALVDRAASLRESRTMGELPQSQPSIPQASSPQPPSRPPPSNRPPPASRPPVALPSSVRSDPVLADLLTSATPEPAPMSSRPRRNAPHTFVAPESIEAKVERPSPRPAPIAEPPPEPASPTTIAAPAPTPTHPPDTSPERTSAAPSAPPPVLPGPPDTAQQGRRRVEPPADREALLARLRDRAAEMTPEKVRAILDAR